MVYFGFDTDWTGNWLWTALPGPENRISNDDTAWVYQAVNERDLRYVLDPALTMASPLIGRALAYNFSSLTKAWTWLPVVPDRSHPFICEIPVHMAADVPVLEKTLGENSCSILISVFWRKCLGRLALCKCDDPVNCDRQYLLMQITE